MLQDSTGSDNSLNDDKLSSANSGVTPVQRPKRLPASGPPTEPEEAKMQSPRTGNTVPPTQSPESVTQAKVAPSQSKPPNKSAPLAPQQQNKTQPKPVYTQSPTPPPKLPLPQPIPDEKKPQKSTETPATFTSQAEQPHNSTSGLDIWGALRMPRQEQYGCSPPAKSTTSNPSDSTNDIKISTELSPKQKRPLTPQRPQSTDPAFKTIPPRTGGWESGTIRRSSTGSAPSLRKELFLSKRRATGELPSSDLEMQHDEASILVYKQQVQEHLQNEEEEIKKIIQNRDKLQQLLEDAVAAKKTVHNEIEPPQLQVLEEIAKGAAARVFKL